MSSEERMSFGADLSASIALPAIVTTSGDEPDLKRQRLHHGSPLKDPVGHMTTLMDQSESRDRFASGASSLSASTADFLLSSTEVSPVPMSPVKQGPDGDTTLTPGDITEEDGDSDISDPEWLLESQMPAFGCVQGMIEAGINPREVLSEICPALLVPDGVEADNLWRIVFSCLSEPPQRKKLPQFNTFQDAVDLIRRSERILVLTGAGISVSCGIPDFRSKDGIYARLHVDFPDLPDPQAMFDITFFRSNPKPFFEFAKEIYPGNFQPSLSHRFIGQLEKGGKLLRNYTQNIDCLEWPAGISKLIQCHGSFATATCCCCGYKTDCEALRNDIMTQQIPKCPVCPPDAVFPVLKPDIVFFGEGLGEEFHRQIREDKDVADLLIVIGSSLKVRPVAMVPSNIKPTIPQILINRESLDHQSFDIELLGNCDVIIGELCKRLGDDFLSLLPPEAGGNHDNRLREIGESELLLPDDVIEKSHVTADIGENGIEANNAEGEERAKLISKLLLQSELGAAPEASASGFESENKQLSEAAANAATTEDGPDTSDEQRELQELRDSYEPAFINLANYLPANCYAFLPPNISLFEGGELHQRLDDDDDSSSTEVSDSSTGSDGGEKEPFEEESVGQGQLDGPADASTQNGECETLEPEQND